MYTVYSDQSRSGSLTCATDAGASDVSWNSSWDCSPLSPSTMTRVSDKFIKFWKRTDLKEGTTDNTKARRTISPGACNAIDYKPVHLVV